jgi:archaellum component FlaC
MPPGPTVKCPEEKLLANNIEMLASLLSGQTVAQELGRLSFSPSTSGTETENDDRIDQILQRLSNTRSTTVGMLSASLSKLSDSFNLLYDKVQAIGAKQDIQEKEIARLSDEVDMVREKQEEIEEGVERISKAVEDIKAKQRGVEDGVKNLTGIAIVMGKDIRVWSKQDAEVGTRRSADTECWFRDLGNSIARMENRLKRHMEETISKPTRSGGSAITTGRKRVFIETDDAALSLGRLQTAGVVRVPVEGSDMCRGSIRRSSSMATSSLSSFSIPLVEGDTLASFSSQSVVSGTLSPISSQSVEGGTHATHDSPVNTIEGVFTLLGDGRPISFMDGTRHV